MGIGFDLQDGNVAARGNFCTVDDDGRGTDRRAGRITTLVNPKLCGILKRIEIENVKRGLLLTPFQLAG
ncbi:MAG: hypothetical protein KFF68_12950 [Desulfosarcina sp.]|nr:hypothetical protein [Desulfosarcina sp.]